MRIQEYNIIRKPQELEDLLNEVRDLLNLGLYQESILNQIPGFSAQEGEGLIYFSSNDKRLYRFINGNWYYTPLRNEQFGWGYFTEASSPYVSQAVSFNEQFSSVPLVFINYIGSRKISDGTPNGPAWFTGALTLRSVICYGITTTGFTATLFSTTGGNLDSTYYSGFCWRAVLL